MKISLIAAIDEKRGLGKNRKKQGFIIIVQSDQHVIHNHEIVVT